MVGTPNPLAALARPTALFTIIVGSWLFRLANWNGWWSIRTTTLSSGVSSACSPDFVPLLMMVPLRVCVSAVTAMLKDIDNGPLSHSS